MNNLTISIYGVNYITCKKEFCFFKLLKVKERNIQRKPTVEIKKQCIKDLSSLFTYEIFCYDNMKHVHLLVLSNASSYHNNRIPLLRRRDQAMELRNI